MQKFKFKAIGTSWIIDIYEDIDSVKESAILAKIMSRIEEFDKIYSRFRADSTIVKVSEKAGKYYFPADSKLLFETYHDLYLKTDGYFTPLVGQILVDAGYDANYSLKQKKELQLPPKWDDVMEFKELALKIKKPVQLDFGAAGKGYIIDLVGKVLEENDYQNYCIDAGGDILLRGKRRVIEGKSEESIRVGLEDPDNADLVIGVYELGNESICGSAGNRRRWGDFTHIMNPKTLSSPTEIVAVWVIADSALIADALTTCLFFVEPGELKDTKVTDASYEFEYLILYKDRSFKKSEHFKGEIFVGQV